MQVSLYLNDNLAKRVSRAAKERGVSVSGYISESVEARLGSEYSPEFIATLGSLKDVDIKRPEQPKLEGGAKREKL
ncbi:MAG: ribbon-helix-helix domain-containing protein [Clostridiales Family XIII bacterium]|nr:ribbon-helix-helix domain-containing protein [Clostridiales Family XIII bacterium]